MAEYAHWLWFAVASLSVVVAVQWFELRAVRARLDEAGHALLWLGKRTGALDSRVDDLEGRSQVSPGR